MLKQCLGIIFLTGELAMAGSLIKAPPPEVAVDTSHQYAEQSGARGTTTEAAVAKWWTALNDPELTTLVERAVDKNLDLKLAGQRLVEARASRRMTRADLLPSVSSTNSFQRIRG